MCSCHFSHSGQIGAVLPTLQIGKLRHRKTGLLSLMQQEGRTLSVLKILSLVSQEARLVPRPAQHQEVDM